MPCQWAEAFERILDEFFAIESGVNIFGVKEEMELLTEIQAVILSARMLDVEEKARREEIVKAGALLLLCLTRHHSFTGEDAPAFHSLDRKKK